MLALVCCRLLACCSVRLDRSALPCAISRLAVDTDSTACRTSPSVPAMRPISCWYSRAIGAFTAIEVAEARST